ncbi:hypothetical protein PQX77_018795 [Marasmius sp. AFHP31]|nr:hypothetical protein PQX77_018795 [Marasmius sp. AFHP31]
MTIISFEIHTPEEGSGNESTSTSQPHQPSPWPLPDDPESTSLGTSLSGHKGPVFPDDSLNYILDIRLGPTLARLRNVPTSPARNSDQNQNSLLPLPNTTSWAVPSEMTRFMRSGSGSEPGGVGTRGRGERGERNSRVPGALDNAE